MSSVPGAACHRVVFVDEVGFLSQGVRAALSAFAESPAVIDITWDTLASTAFEMGTVVLFDLREPAIARLALLDAAVKATRAPVAVFAEELTPGMVLECFRHGACGLVSKKAEPVTLLAQLHELASGAMSVDRRVGGELARFASAAPLAAWPGRGHGLSLRESEVLVLLAGGLTNREIAAQLIVGLETVKSHASAVFRKLGVRNRAEAATAQDLFKNNIGGISDPDPGAYARADMAMPQAAAATDAPELNDRLTQALDGRIILEQAKGILAERESLDIDQAFTWLQSYARTHDLHLADVARGVVEGRLALIGPPPALIQPVER